MITVFLFEIRFRLRQVSTYLFAGILYLLAMLFISTDVVQLGGGDGRVQGNAPYVIAVAGTVLTALGAIIASALMGTAIYRDFEANAHELFFTTRLTKRDYFFGRFLGAFVVTFLVFCAIPLGFLAGAAAPWAAKTTFGAFRPETYGTYLLVYLLPNLFLIGTLFFVFGALTRSLLAIYTQGVLLLVGWATANQLLRSLENRELAALFDPFGLAATSLATRYWTLAEKNSSLVPLTGPLLWNRVLWVGVGIVIFAVGYRLFAFSKNPIALRRQKAQAAPHEAMPVPAATLRPGSFAAPGNVAVYARLTGFYFREIVRGMPFLVITLAGVLLLLVAATQADKLFDTPIYPVTRVMVEAITGSFGLFFLILITFYTGELVWRERVLRLDQVNDALPISTAAVMLAKATAVLLMLGVLNVALIATGVLIQAMKGYYHFELPVYFGYIFGGVFPEFVCLTLLAFFLHAIVNNKFLGHTCLILVFISSAVLPALHLERNLYRFANTPTLTYSDMNGFGPFVAPVFWFTLYWLAISTILFVLALRLWVRGKEDALATRWQRGRVGPIGAGIAGLAGLTALGVGGFIFYNTDILNDFTPRHIALWRQATYERTYKAVWEKRPMPRITDVVLDMDMHPEERQYSVRGTYQLKNKTDKPITEIVLQTDPDQTVKSLTFTPAATPGITDEKNGFRTFKFAQPMKPGEQAKLDFVVAYDRRGFTNDGAQTAITGNGSFVTMPGPSIGYQPHGEIADEKERKRQKLPPRPRMAPLTDRAARGDTYLSNDSDWIHFDATVRTVPDQIAMAPGYLEKEWTENGRRCFHYKMDAPIRNFYSFLSARYTVKKDVWVGKNGKKVALEIYYHAPHAYNIDRMMAGMKAALSYCSDNYTPYQFRQLRILEFPNYAQFAQSFPNTIPYSEGIGFIARVSQSADDIDYPYYVTAHETAHQWWAHQVLGGNVEGSTMLSESLAEYTALQILEKKYGPDQIRRFLRYDLDRYLRGRGSERESENPLVTVQNQQYIHYPKGALVFYALADRIGEARLNATLARFARDKGFQEPPYTTSMELLEYLRQDTPPEDREFLSDLFEKITIYNLRATKAKSEKLPNGKWRVTLTVSATKAHADGSGKETPVPINDLLDIGVFAKPAKPTRDKEELGKPILLQREHLTTAEKTFTFEVSEEPDKAGIDPYNKMIDRLPSDNTTKVVAGY